MYDVEHFPRREKNLEGGDARLREEMLDERFLAREYAVT
jgi:hypothetical protein